MDLYTTFIDFAGVSIPTDRVIDGISLRTSLLNHTEVPRYVGWNDRFFLFQNSMSSWVTICEMILKKIQAKYQNISLFKGIF